MRYLLISLLFMASITACSADPFDAAASKYNLDANLLRAIAQVETRQHPYAIRVGDLSFYPDKRREANRILYQALNYPILVTAQDAQGNAVRRWYSNRMDAAMTAKRRQWFNVTIQRIDDSDIDIGMMQINWRWHRHRISSPYRLLDPGYNARYAARLLRRHIDQHGRHQGIGNYHSTTTELNRQYRRKVLAAHERLLADNH